MAHAPPVAHRHIDNGYQYVALVVLVAHRHNDNGYQYVPTGYHRNTTGTLRVARGTLRVAVSSCKWLEGIHKI